VSLYRLSVGLFLLCGLLLLTYGGAVIAGPVTLPLTYLAVRRHPTRPFRWVGGALAGLTTVEVAWALVYVFDGETKPSIWLLPLTACVVVLALFVSLGGAARQASRSSRSPSRNQTSTSSRRRR